jgi:hypothetical protein
MRDQVRVFAPLFIYFLLHFLKGFFWPHLSGLSFFGVDVFCFIVLPSMLLWYYTMRLKFELRSFYEYDAD